MTQDPLHITLDTLRSEREGAERRASELAEELNQVGQRLMHLRGAIENIEALLGIPSVDEENALNYELEDVPHGVTVRELDFTNVPDAPPNDAGVSVTRKRVPSTDWVADVVNSIGGPADRDTIFQTFGHVKGFPEAWTNPRNSVNNALGRAVERGMIQKINENLFAPLGYRPASDLDDREES